MEVNGIEGAQPFPIIINLFINKNKCLVLKEMQLLHLDYQEVKFKFINQKMNMY